MARKVRRWTWVLEAALELISMKALVAWTSPASYAFLLGGKECWPKERLSVPRLKELIYSLEAAGRYAPKAINCLPRALALQRMLLRRGARASVRFGARRVGEDFRAHAWLTLEGKVILGNLPDLNEYAVFSRWPGKGKGFSS